MLNKSGNGLVIVTTRDAGVLKNAGITVTYNLRGMHTDQAKELFSCHAFSHSYPSSGYEKLVDLFVEVCGGLPLSLQVLGSHVHGTDQEFWKLELEKVKKMLPQDIHNRLKISIDKLDKEEKQIFMDCACFFIGESVKDAIGVWEASRWSAQHALQRLKNKCLVEEIKPFAGLENARVILRMHDHLRDLGREMADELNHPRRLWRSEDLQSLESKGFKSILTQPKFRCLHSFMDPFMGCHIKYFLGESGNTLEPSSALLWLVVDCCYEFTSIPYWIPLQNLQYLVIISGSLEILWQNNEQAPLALKDLRIYNIMKLEELNMGLLHSLDVLVIDSCWDLKSLTGISELTKLEKLDIRGCGKLEELSLVRLKGLKEIRIDGCHHLKSVRTSDLIKLEKLDISRCRELEELSLVRFKGLKEIRIDGCHHLKSVRTSDLIKLEELDIRGCGELEELSLVCLSSLEFCSISGLPRLEKIEVKGCKNLISIDDPSREPVKWNNYWKLVKLNIYDSPKLKKIPIEILPIVESVQFLYCSNETIGKYILNMKKLPSNFIKVIGQAADGAESTLNADLFCDFMSAKSDEIDRYFVNEGKCFPFDYLCFPEDAMVKSVTIPVMRGEEHQVLNVLCRIVDNLYQK